MRSFMFLLLAILPFVYVPAGSAAVPTESGLVEGVSSAGVEVYRGVPFAAPPVGDLRWRAPQKVTPWHGVRKARDAAPSCEQAGVSMPGEILNATSEDCLYLNIWTPASGLNARLPVFVWIHGGGFANGSASMPLYSGEALARRGVVVVTVAYRLGVFGFLTHPALSAETAEKSSGNYGILDQIAALRWVNNNIAAFGGDPNQITIGGQSAGSSSVSILMTTPLARGMFHRAIGQSGGFFEPVQIAPQFLLANAERAGAAFGRLFGTNSAAELRSIPAKALLRREGGALAHPVIDRFVLPETPYDVFASGRQARVPLLVGSNAEEARAFGNFEDVTASNFAEKITKTFGALPPPLLAAYPFSNDAEARQARVNFETDLRFGWNMWAWAKLHAKTRQPTYLYRFAQKPPFPAGSPYAGWGASHFAELWYMFGHLEQQPWRWSNGDRQVADVMGRAWVNFIRTGRPDGQGLTPWPQASSSSGPLLVFENGARVGESERVKALETFDAVYAQIRGR